MLPEIDHDKLTWMQIVDEDNIKLLDFEHFCKQRFNQKKHNIIQLI